MHDILTVAAQLHTVLNEGDIDSGSAYELSDRLVNELVPISLTKGALGDKTLHNGLHTLYATLITGQASKNITFHDLTTDVPRPLHEHLFRFCFYSCLYVLNDLKASSLELLLTLLPVFFRLRLSMKLLDQIGKTSIFIRVLTN